MPASSNTETRAPENVRQSNDQQIGEACDLLQTFHLEKRKEYPDDATGFVSDECDILIISDHEWRRRLRMLFDYADPLLVGRTEAETSDQSTEAKPSCA